jgi:protocatechuate 3,4-dioxygenase beta subunit
MNHDFLLGRRRLLGGVALGAAAWLVPGVFADELTRTPAMTEGPFYPERLPLDTDNDLLIINDGITPAVGEITHLTGRVLTPAGAPVRNAVVEIWQVDNNGAYLHSGTSNAERRDRHFQGFGRCATSARGEYYFRTVKPVSYPGRCPHIHVMVKRGDRQLLTTQLFISGHPGNARDFIYRSLRSPRDREAVSIEFRRIDNSRIAECNAVFDIVLGVTPAEPEGER